MVDDIVLGYVVSIVEESDFDVDSFVEVMGAYVPEFSLIPHSQVSSWMFSLASKLGSVASGSEKESKPDNLLFPQLCTLSSEQRSPKTSESSCECDSGFGEGYQCEEESENVRVLVDMFPTSCSVEASHCLSISGGDLDKAAQLMLYREDAGQAIRPDPQNVGAIRKIKKNSNELDDKVLRQQILQKYSFVDQDEDKKEHRPPPVKYEPKKLIRYRDGKIVSIKGERFSEIKNTEDDNMKHTYVNLKPAKQYRFH